MLRTRGSSNWFNRRAQYFERCAPCKSDRRCAICGDRSPGGFQRGWDRQCETGVPASQPQGPALGLLELMAAGVCLNQLHPAAISPAGQAASDATGMRANDHRINKNLPSGHRTRQKRKSQPCALIIDFLTAQSTEFAKRAEDQ
jgi:hypothetical protein